jgi:hypothetical protein
MAAWQVSGLLALLVSFHPQFVGQHFEMKKTSVQAD